MQKLKLAEQNKQARALKAAKNKADKGPAQSYQDILRDQQSNLRKQAAAKTTETAPQAV